MTEISSVSGLRGVREQRGAQGSGDCIHVHLTKQVGPMDGGASSKRYACQCGENFTVDVQRTEVQFGEAALSLPPSPQPFLWAIEKANGEWYDGDNCVFDDMASAQDSVDETNDNLPKEDWLRVVPLYRAPAGTQGQVQGCRRDRQ